MNRLLHTKNRKKLLVAGILLASVISLVLSVSAFSLRWKSKAAVTTSDIFFPTNLFAWVDHQIAVPVMLSTNGAEIVGVDLVITYPNGSLALVDIQTDATIGTTLKTFAPISSTHTFKSAEVIADANTTGILKFSALTTDAQNRRLAPFNGTTTLAQLIFKPLREGVYHVITSVHPNQTTDSNVILLANPPVDIQQHSSDLALTVTASDTPLRGDINMDNQINALDYVLLFESFGHNTGELLYNSQADIAPPAGPDGEINALDYLAFIDQYKSLTLLLPN